MSTVRLRLLALTGVLAMLSVAWSALPFRPAAASWICLGVAVISVSGSLIDLAMLDAAVQRPLVETFVERQVRALVAAARSAPWTELMLISVLLLEAEHPQRPWHTGVLLLALLCYLLAVQLAETGASARALRVQLPQLAAGAGLAVLAIGAAALPGLPAGGVAVTIRFIAAAAALAAAAMVIPTWLSEKR